jgi:predicted XRE-type DNA-binding protein
VSGEADRLKKKWDLLKALDEKHEIGRLRLRADVAEAIRDCLNSGMLKKEVAVVLQVDPTRVTRLIQGNYRADQATLVRRNTENYRLKWVEVEPQIIFIDRPADEDVAKQSEVAVCLYCGDPAKFIIEWEDKKITVCRAHKPPEVARD